MKSRLPCNDVFDNYENDIPETKETKEPNKPKYQTPSVMLTNCRSITLDKIDELNLIIEEKSPQVIMLTETWLTEEKESTRLIEGYNLHASHRDKKRIGGGVAIFTHQSLNTKTVYKKTTTRYSTVWVKVSDKKGHSVIYGCVYHPKSKNNSETEDILRHISETMVNLASKHSEKFSQAEILIIFA